MQSSELLRFPIFGLMPVNEEKVREEADDTIDCKGSNRG